MTIPVCAWCGRYRAASGSLYCSICRQHEAEIEALIEATRELERALDQ